METTFISIHDLEVDARILYSSDSVIDILGYTPDELVNRSAWEFFPPEELSFAKKAHRRQVSMDKAAVLAYCRVRSKGGDWVGCECCFTIVYDVMVVCTSVYKCGLPSWKRAEEAPVVRRIFSSSPNDPRYHMLSHLSPKFRQTKQVPHEPRAALFLNRFTRTLSIMYATSAIREIIGITAADMRGRSFYYCIAENCLSEAVKCLENAKGNDSIAYLRFWFRDPRQDDTPAPPDSDSDEEMTNTGSSEGGGVGLSVSSAASTGARSADSMDLDSGARGSSNESPSAVDTQEAILGKGSAAHSSASSTPSTFANNQACPPIPNPAEPLELEAVISCSSDGMVVCLRRARPMIPHPTRRPSKPVHPNGLFAAPWATEPIIPPMDARENAGFGPPFAPSLSPHGARQPCASSAAFSAQAEPSGFMSSIRDQAVFAWALTGINGKLSDFSSGKPMGEAVPRQGLPVWASDPD